MRAPLGPSPLTIPPQSLAQSHSPRIAETKWTAANGREMVLALNNRAAMCLEDASHISFFAFCFAPRPGFSWLALLAYAASAMWRKENGLHGLTLDQWVDGDWLPHYFSQDWQKLGEALRGLIDQTFPDAAEHRAILASVTAAMQSNSSGIGTDLGLLSDHPSPAHEMPSAG